MPYRHAHWWVLALVPAIAIAFWPGYFGQIGVAPFALHAHGMTASAWLALVAAQSWSIQSRRIALHRLLGLATFVLVPLFAGAGVLVLQSMAALFVAQSDPFHVEYGARLATSDAIAAPTFVALVALALARRREVGFHSAAMLSTVLLVLPPILGRLFPAIPGFPGAVGGFSAPDVAFFAGWMVPLAGASWLAWRNRAGRLPFGIAAVSTLAQFIAFATIGRTAAWGRVIAGLTHVRALPLALSAVVVSALLLWWAWQRTPARPTRVRADEPVTV